jgi:predicted GIY-YIG superfamily endonuclease
MPRKQIDYSRTSIYKIICNDITINDVYVGSTTDFKKRKCQHKTACKTTNNKIKVYNIIRDNGGWDNWSMVEIEKYPCNDGNEARARERYYYDILNASMNTVRPFTTEEEKTIDAIEQKKKSRNKLMAENIDLYYIRKGINDMKYFIKHYTETMAFKSTMAFKPTNMFYPTKEYYIEQLEEFQKLLIEELKKPKANTSSSKASVTSSEEASVTSSEEASVTSSEEAVETTFIKA